MAKYWDQNFESLDEALEGMATLALAHIKLNDGVERWYRIFPTPTD